MGGPRIARLTAQVQSAAPFDDGVIADAIRDGWHVSPEGVSYAPVGYGSWHWYASSAAHGRLFVTADRVAAEGDAPSTTRPRRRELEWAYGVPLALVRSGLEIARPPIPTSAGTVLAGLDDGWVVSVWPLIEGRATHDGTYSARADAEAVLALVDALHAVPMARVSVGTSPPRLETFHLPGRARLLELVDEPWAEPHVGPHAAAAEELLHRHREDVHGLVRLYDELVQRAPPVEEWVVTHGEPHAANVVFAEDGPRLIDWDTAKVAPRERDLWMIAADGFSVSGADRHMLRLYRAQWDLGELDDYARRFADPTDDGPAGHAAWDDFTDYVFRAAHV